MRDFETWADSLRLVGDEDEAWTPEEWEKRQRRAQQMHDYYLRHKERIDKYNREWAKAHRDRMNASKQRWRIKQRDEMVRAGTAVRIVASLHSLACTGPTRATGCRCRKVRITEAV